MEDLIYISEDGINRVVNDVYDHIERINSILNHLNDLILESKDYFIAPVNDQMINLYSEMKLNIDNFKSNLSSYPVDLIKAKNKFSQKSNELKLDAIRRTAEIQSGLK